MTLKYRLLVAVLLTLIAIGYQVALAQTKTVKKDFTIFNSAACNCNVSIAPAITPPSACNLKNGSVITSISGGSGSFSFQWRDQTGAVVSTGKDLTNAGTGYYFLEVKDINAPYCGIYYSNYALPSTLNISGTVKNNVGCLTPNGAVTITATGGSGTYTYLWTYPDGSQVASKNISGLKVGSYYLTVTDATLGCVTARSFSIESNTQLAVVSTATTENTSCASPNGGTSVTVTGGSGQYDYMWYNLQTYGIAGTSSDLDGVRGGEYNALVTDRISGCISYRYVTIGDKTIAPGFILSDITPNTTCAGPFNGSVKLQPSETAGPFEATWTDGTRIVSTAISPQDLPPGNYGFTLTDSQTKCNTTVTIHDPDAVIILDESKPNIILTINELNDNTGCDTSNGKINLSISDPTTPYSIAWTGPDGFTSRQEDISSLAPGTYELTIETVCNNPPVIKTPPMTSSESTISLSLAGLISDPENNLDIHSICVTDPPLSLAKASISGDQVLTIDYSGLSFRGVDKLKIRACDLLAACTDQLITIEVAGGVVVYNAVSPNSTGHDNQYMRIENLPEKNRVYIYNRWGDVVFEVNQYDDKDPQKRFEGLTSSGKLLPSGTYLYKIELDGKAQPVTGYLSLKQ